MSDQVISKQYFDKAIEGMNRYHVLCEGFQADLATARAEVERLTNLLDQERQFICRKCGLREELGQKTDVTF